MKMNFRAIVEEKRLPTSTPLLPLFEAIINSIHSIDEAGVTDGSIIVNVIRDITPFGGEYWETDIYSFEVTDNGIGFNDKNYASFDIYGSDYKLAVGCKGVGRVQWLRAFSKVSIESTYIGDDEKYYDRKFEFSILDERKDLEHHESEKTNTGTTVILTDYFRKYKSKCPKKIDTLARDIMNHCFTYLALGACPQIIIKDEQETRNINALFKEYTKGQLHVSDFNVNGFSFKIIGAKNYAPVNDKHRLHFCAHNREVFGDKLSNNIKELTGKLFNDDGEFIYSGYITGDLLAANINSERTEFVFAKLMTTETDSDDSNFNEQLALEGVESDKSVTKHEIVEAAVPIIKEFLFDEISAYNAQKKERIENYVYSKNPRYRSLIKHNSECMDKIPFTNDDGKLELELFKQEQQYRLQLKIEEQAVLAEDVNSALDSSYVDRCANLLQKTSDMGKDDLADYIIHRKVMLSILEHAFKSFSFLT